MAAAAALPPEPRANPLLAGHDEAARTMAEAARSRRLHHAWLIAGPQGLGKATLAYRFARWMLAGQPEAAPGGTPLAVPESDPVFRRVAVGAHADLFTLAPSTGEKGRKEVLRAEDARAAVRFMAHTAAEIAAATSSGGPAPSSTTQRPGSASAMARKPARTRAWKAGSKAS